MKESINYVKNHLLWVYLSTFVLVLILFGLFSQADKTGNIPTDSYFQMQRQVQQATNTPQTFNTPRNVMQNIAMPSNSLKLAMGVTLVGKGKVVSVTPGSKAQRAGIQVGDVINRINGK